MWSGSAFAQTKNQLAPVKAPEVFRGEVNPDQNSIGDLKWFEVFKDPELQKLIRTAMVQNYDLRTAGARINAARANLGLARSDQFPQFEASADLETTRTSRNGQLAQTGQGGQRRSFGSVLLNLLTFEIDVWGRLRNQTKAARAELRATEEDRKAVMTTVVGDVAAGYFNLLELDSQLDIAKRTLATRENSLRLIKARQEGGLATMLDVRQAEELVYLASQTIPDTERSMEQTENQISLLLGNNPGPITRGRPLAQQEELPAVPAGLPSSLLERRPDIQAAEENLVAQRALVSAARAAYFPRISLTGLLGFQSNQLTSLFSGTESRVEFHSASHAADFHGWSFEVECEVRTIAAGACSCRVSADDSKRVSGSFGCAGAISQGERDSRSAGAACLDASGSSATCISTVRRRS